MLEGFPFVFVLSEEASIARSFPVGFSASFGADEVAVVDNFVYCISDMDSNFGRRADRSRKPQLESLSWADLAART